MRPRVCRVHIHSVNHIASRREKQILKRALRPPGPSEDPFTGSATGAMAAYLWHHDLMAKDTFIVEQGHGMGRPGRAMVTRVGPADAMTGIRVAGSGFVLMRGQADLPAAGG